MSEPDTWSPPLPADHILLPFVVRLTQFVRTQGMQEILKSQDQTLSMGMFYDPNSVIKYGGTAH
jgi:hypothetical protein